MTFEGNPAEARTYARLELATGVVASVVLFLFLLAMTASVWSSDRKRWVRSLHWNPHVALLIFASPLRRMALCLLTTSHPPIGFFQEGHRSHTSRLRAAEGR